MPLKFTKSVKRETKCINSVAQVLLLACCLSGPSLADGNNMSFNSTSYMLPADDAFRECLIEPSLLVELGTPVAGILAQIKVDRGDWVDKGALIASIDSRAERAALELAEVRVAYTQRRLDRNSEMAKKSLVSLQELDELKTEVDLAKLELHQREVTLSLRDILSPLDGVVVDRKKSVGEFVDEEEILTLAQIDPLHVEVVLPISKLGTIKTGDQAKIIPQKPLNGELRAEVIVIDQVVDAASGTFRVRLNLPNPDHKIPAGLRCIIDFPES